MANEMIRANAVDAELVDAVCEICGTKGMFKDFLWCNPCDVIHCTTNHGCIETHIHCNQYKQNNILIRTCQATDEEMTGFMAWCEVCGMKNVYGAMYHDFTQDIIMCREHVGGPSVTQLINVFNKVNSDCMRDGADSVPFSDIDYYAEQIELIFGVTEIRAYELATQLSKETRMKAQTIIHTVEIPTFNAEGAYHMSVGFFDCKGNKQIIEVNPDTVIIVDEYFAPCGECGVAVLQSVWGSEDFCKECEDFDNTCHICDNTCHICDEKIDCGDYTETTDTGCVHAYCSDIEKERTMFKMTGFKHVTEAGVKDYLQTMDSEGSIGLLWDISNQRRADILMQEAEFDMTTYCKRYSTTEEEFDNVMVDLHEELVDARFALEHAFIQNLDEITCPVGKRTFSGIQSVKSEDWNPKVYYPMTKEQFEFTDIEKEFANFCMEKTAEGYEVQACIITGEPSDIEDHGYIPQDFEWLITGAADFYLCLDMINVLTMYPNIKVVAQLTK